MFEDAVIRLFGDAGRVRESNPGTKLVSMIQTVVSRALSKGFRNAPFYTTVDELLEECVSKPSGADAVVAKLLHAPSFTVPVAKFVGHEVEKNSINKAKMVDRFVKLAAEVEKRKVKVEDGISTRRN